MTRPQFVRADTLDLQDHDHPIAQDHSSPPRHPAPLGVGPPAAHQDSALRHVAAERYAEREHLAETWGSNHNSAATSSRTSHEGSDLLDEDNNMFADVDHERVVDGQNLQQDPPDDDGEEVDESGDEIMDDDMIDKISSSPSITDGTYDHFPCACSTHEIGDSRDESDVSGTASFPTIYTFGPLADLSNTSLSEDHHHLSGRYGGEEAAWWGDRRQSHNLHEQVRRRRISGEERQILFGREDLWPIEEEDEEEEDGLEEKGAVEDDEGIDVCDLLWRDDEDIQDDDSKDFSLLLTRHIDSGWGGECLQDTEEIDFEFVYALHTFVATVEGQANATKGETMVLLDDTNSYWWLVRVVKDNSIGYLPAEHIETPTERLARLNKHRNQELSSSMLQDTQEKTKNSLKKAMRRRNAKMVQFSQPTYFDAAEMDWSDVDNDQTGSEDMDDDDITSQTESQATAGATDDVSSANAQLVNGEAEEQASKAVNGQQAQVALKDDQDEDPETTLADEDLAPKSTRNGTIRNTDSFFKDDKAEPKKISLTPNLLREDSASSSARSSESKDKFVEIFDQIDKSAASDNKAAAKEKEERKRKEKKPGMLSGLFKKKDKKLKVDEATGGIVKAKDAGPDSPSYATAEFSTEPAPTSPTGQSVKRQSNGGKLTKTPPQPQPLQPSTKSDGLNQPSPNGANAQNRDAAAISSTEPKPAKDSKPTLAVKVPDDQDERLEPGKKDSEKTSPLATLLGNETPKKEKLKKAKQRMQLDVDSSPDSETPSPNPSTVNLNATQPSDALAFSQRQPDDEPLTSPTQSAQHRSNNILGTPTPSEAPSESATTANEYFSAAESASPERSSTPTNDNPSPSESTTATNTPTATTHTISTTNPYVQSLRDAGSASTTPKDATFNNSSAGNISAAGNTTTPNTKFDPAALSRYIQTYGHSSVRDLLVIVHDTTGVKPVAADHPLMLKLGFREKQQRLKDMERELDGIVGELLARRGHPAGFRGRPGAGSGSVNGNGNGASIGNSVNATAGSGSNSAVGRVGVNLAQTQTRNLNQTLNQAS